MQNKKGAIELSMSTIIVVILGIALLSLGLVWVRGNLTQITDLSDQAFDLSEQQIQDLFSDSDSLVKISPDSVDIKKGKDGIMVGVIFYNNKPGNTPIQIKATVEKLANGLDVSCKFYGTDSESLVYSLNPGQSETIKLEVKKTDSTGIGAAGCKITPEIAGSSETLNPEVLTVSILG